MFGLMKKILSHLSGASLIKRQMNYFNRDLKNLRNNVNTLNSGVKKDKPQADNWNDFIIQHGIEASGLFIQYKKRKLISYVLICFLIYFLYESTVLGNISIGLAGCVLTFLFYFKNVFRLYQIRTRNLCAVKSYLNAVRVSFKEILPLNLPSHWQLMNENNTGHSKGDNAS